MSSEAGAKRSRIEIREARKTNRPDGERVVNDVEVVVGEGESVVDIVLNEAVERVSKVSLYRRTRGEREEPGSSSSRAVRRRIATGRRQRAIKQSVIASTVVSKTCPHSQRTESLINPNNLDGLSELNRQLFRPKTTATSELQDSQLPTSVLCMLQDTLDGGRGRQKTSDVKFDG